MAKKQPAYVQEPPFCIQVELTEGCNLRCEGCGIHGIREKAGGPYKFMTEETADRFARQVAAAGWNCRIEMAMHGEPSLNPEVIDIVRAMRHHLPKHQLMMTSNGTGFLKDTANRIRAVFDAGLNILALDDYEAVNIVPKVLERAMVNELAFSGVVVKRYPQDGLEWSPHRRWPKSARMIIVIEDIQKAKEGSHAKINNHAGYGGAPNESKAGVRCAKPFRELGIRHDGKVAGCCIDWSGTLKAGDIRKMTIEEIWHGPLFQAMRRKLYHGQRDFGPCAGCDHETYRLGLLPDKLGKHSLPEPDATTEATLKAAMAGRSYTPIVFQPWMPKGKK
jgi:MoaA/NifB/PqqE/SkfB family radical SAM enzyme